MEVLRLGTWLEQEARVAGARAGQWEDLLGVISISRSSSMRGQAGCPPLPSVEGGVAARLGWGRGWWVLAQGRALGLEAVVSVRVV